MLLKTKFYFVRVNQRPKNLFIQTFSDKNTVLDIILLFSEKNKKHSSISADDHVNDCLLFKQHLCSIIRSRCSFPAKMQIVALGNPGVRKYWEFLRPGILDPGYPRFSWCLEILGIPDLGNS